MHGENQSFINLYNLFVRYQKLSFKLTLLLVVVGYFLLEPIVTIILPDYKPGILACKAMMIAAIPYSLIENANKFLISLECKRLYLWTYLASIISFLFSVAILFQSNSITALNLAWCFFISFLFYSIILNYNIYRLKKMKNKYQ